MASTNPTPTTEQVASGALSMEQVLLSIMKNQETISSTIGMLREDVDNLKISPPAPKKAMSNTFQTPHQKLRNEAIPARSQSEPPVSKVTAQKKPAPSSAKSKSSTKNTPPSFKTPVKRNPFQMQSVDFHPEFKGVKTPLLENEANVQALAERQLQTVKLARGVSRIGVSYQSYIQGALACLGFSRCSPNLAQNSKDLYNVACQILAITTFQQVAAAGSFDNQNVNLSFIMQMGLLQKAYNHFVHYFMKAWYDKEEKLGGSVKAAGAKNSINKSRERVS
ncbi:hypothetical protein O181_069589 [Austropuccinia psidii MF-1]|uniref:Uncharacterized protein n=1 Tax=Austropuccinia psidii MF-1 TaxID=1389203 RepID=A0A9Q3EZ55_9BASI|nr:hypothetical protein [Austropuccinia psidii MF-1]